MKTIAVEVSEQTLAHYGEVALQAKIQKILDLDTLRLKANEINKALQEANIDADALFEEAREKAWESYEQTILKDILPTNA